jgi:hypothetical protein
MAAVNFYKFAAAVMEVLEPDKYNFTRNISALQQTAEPEATTLVSDDSIVAAKTLLTVAKMDAPLQSTAAVIAADPDQAISTSTTSSEKEAQTIAAIAEHLTVAINNASDESLAKVAQAIKEAAVDTAVLTTAVAAPSVAETIIQAKSNIFTNADDAAELVKTTVAALATQTTKEIKEESNQQTAEIAETVALPQPTIELPRTITQIVSEKSVVETLEEKATELVTTAITDKIKEKTTDQIANKTAEPSVSSVVSTNPETKSLVTSQPVASSKSSADIEEKIDEQKEPTKDFWDLFPELDFKDNQYYGVISDLYNFMSHGTMMDSLNPEIDFDERSQFVGKALQASNQKVNWEASNLQQSRQLRDDSESSIRNEERQAKEATQARQEQMQKWHQEAQAKLDMRRAEERLKGMK